jgi:hypothetical protein
MLLLLLLLLLLVDTRHEAYAQALLVSVVCTATVERLTQALACDTQCIPSTHLQLMISVMVSPSCRKWVSWLPCVWHSSGPLPPCLPSNATPAT